MDGDSTPLEDTDILTIGVKEIGRPSPDTVKGYGVLIASQMRQLAYVACYYDRGYGHFTTRPNIQFNWPRLADAPDILAVLAEADLHAIQTSGNCVRNVTTDHFAGAAAEEVVDPRLYAEILRQWSTDHPEFTYVLCKFKIAVGRRDDIVTTGMTTIVVMVVAAISSANAWRQPVFASGRHRCRNRMQMGGAGALFSDGRLTSEMRMRTSLLRARPFAGGTT
jgi:hypothetical protein